MGSGSIFELPVMTTHGNPPLAIGGPPVATGEGKLDYMEAFPPVATDGLSKFEKFEKF